MQSCALFHLHNLVYMRHFIFCCLLHHIVVDKYVTCNWTLRVDVNRLWLQRNPSNCGSAGNPKNVKQICLLSRWMQNGYYLALNRTFGWRRHWTIRNEGHANKTNLLNMHRRRSLVWWGLNLHPISLLPMLLFIWFDIIIVFAEYRDKNK